MNSKCIKAIVIDQVNNKPVGRGPYRNIRNVPGSIKNYMRNMKKLFPAAVHVNFYDSSGHFLFQERYQDHYPREQVAEKKHKTLKVTHLDNGFYTTGEARFFNDLLFSQWDP